MWPFGKKKTGIYYVAREEEEQDVCQNELPSFAPEIQTDENDDLIKHINSVSADMERPSKAFFDRESEQSDFTEVSEEADITSEEPTENPPQDRSEEQYDEQIDGEEEEELPEESERDPRELFTRLCALPYCSRRYALYNGKMYLAYPDEEGGLYLFEEFGEYITATPEECTAFARISAVSGVFKGKTYTSSELEYITKENAWPLSVLAHNKQQYETAVKDGYKFFKRTPDGKAMVLAKPISLHRFKDLLLKVELTTTEEEEVVTAPYQVEISRADLERPESEKQYKELMKALIERILSFKSRFFTVQVLKCKKNLVVCFPLDGNGKVGDRFAGGVITATAPVGDGTVLFQIGNDQEITLPLDIGSAQKGQYRITLN